jgi:hypothetical protein
VEKKLDLDVYAPLDELIRRVYAWLKAHQVIYLSMVFIVSSLAGFTIAYAVVYHDTQTYCQRAGFAEYEVTWDFQRSCLRTSYSQAP